MLKHQKKEIKFNFIKEYYESNYFVNLDYSLKKIIKINYNNLIFHLIFKSKIIKFNKFKFNYLNVKYKKIYKSYFFNKMFLYLKYYFNKNKSFIFFKKYSNKNFFFNQQKNYKFIKIKKLKQKTKLLPIKLWFKKNIVKKKLKLSKWKLDRLYSFKKFFFKFSKKIKFKKTIISQIKLNDYTLRSKFKTAINFENLKTQYGIIKIKPSGANIFITLTNFYGNVFLLYLLVFLMKFVVFNKKFKRSFKTIRAFTCI